MHKLSIGAILFTVAGLFVAIAVFLLMAPKAGSGVPVIDPGARVEITRLFVLVFSILSGFLIAAITMLGDPKSLMPGSWRAASAHRRQIVRAVDRLVLLFYIYLVIVSIAILAPIMETHFPTYFECILRVFFAAGSAAIIWSFALPYMIRRECLERIDEEVENRS